MKKILLYVIALSICAFYMTSCSVDDHYEERSHYAFGTIITAKIWGKSASSVSETVDRCFDELDRLETVFSSNSESSELSSLNRNAYANDYPVSDELFYVIKTALQYCEVSDGALDISIGKLINLWGIGTVNEKIPEETEIEPLLATDYTQIILNDESKTVHYTSEYVQIDLGAVAKGYAGDRMVEILKDSDITGAMLSLGGNIVTYGTKPGGDSFTIGITDPKSPDRLSGSVTVNKEAVVTSGDYQRFFEYEGVRYHHILDASTGYPSESGISGVTIICESSLKADCLSTAVFILGKVKGLELLRETNAQAVIIETNGDITATRGISAFSFVQYGGIT